MEQFQCSGVDVQANGLSVLHMCVVKCTVGDSTAQVTFGGRGLSVDAFVALSKSACEAATTLCLAAGAPGAGSASTDRCPA